jgi:hypothetical protein
MAAVAVDVTPFLKYILMRTPSHLHFRAEISWLQNNNNNNYKRVAHDPPTATPISIEV